MIISSLFINKVLAQVLERENTSQSPGGNVTLKNPLGSTSFIQIINNILNYLIYISIPILALMILIGGFQILTARDNPEKVNKGRHTIMYAVIGFIIILVSKGVALIFLKIIG